MTATVNIRWVTCERIVALLRQSPQLVGVTVEPGWPGDRDYPLAEIIWIDEVDGPTEIPVMTGGRKQRTDEFDVAIQIKVTGQITLDDTMSRVSTLMAAIENELADDTTLGDLDGVLSAEVSRMRMTSARLPEGPSGFAEVTVTVSTRLL